MSKAIISIGWLAAIVALASVLLVTYGGSLKIADTREGYYAAKTSPHGPILDAPAAVNGKDPRSPAEASNPDPEGPQASPSGLMGIDTSPSYAEAGISGGSSAGGCQPRDRLKAEDLLPADQANSLWAQRNPAGQGAVGDKQFLNSAWNIGMSTSTLRNANLQLRSEPLAPRTQPSIWNLSTIEPDVQRRPLEVGDH